MGKLLFFVFYFYFLCSRNFVSTSIYLLILAYLFFIFLLYISNCDSPSPDITPIALLCLAEIIYKFISLEFNKSPENKFKFDEYVDPSRTNLVFK